MPIEVQCGLRNPSKLFLRLVLASLEHGADSDWVHPLGPPFSGIAKPLLFLMIQGTAIEPFCMCNLLLILESNPPLCDSSVPLFLLI